MRTLSSFWLRRAIRTTTQQEKSYEDNPGLVLVVVVLLATPLSQEEDDNVGVVIELLSVAGPTLSIATPKLQCFPQLLHNCKGLLSSKGPLSSKAPY